MLSSRFISSRLAKPVVVMSSKRARSVSTRAEILNISGIFPPIPTPFTQTGKMDLDHLKTNFLHWNGIPFKGYVALGSNGESVALSRSEKLSFLKSVRSFCRRDSLIIAGLGCYGTEETVELCKEVGASNLAHAALIITPSFYKGQITETELGKFYETVADQSPLPVILYSVPANTSIDLSPDLVKNLAAHPNIIGLKDSGGDITKISRIVYETSRNGEKFQILAGSAGFLLPSLLMGSVGGVCALANVLGNEICELYNLFNNMSYEAAVELQRRLILPNTMVTRAYGVPGLKFAMDRMGLYGGPCRLPLLPLSSSAKKQVDYAFMSQKFFPE